MSRDDQRDLPPSSSAPRLAFSISSRLSSTRRRPSPSPLSGSPSHFQREKVSTVSALMCAAMVKRRASKSPTGSTPSKARKKENKTEEDDETSASESLEAPRTASKRALSMTTAAIRKRREREKKRKEAEEAMEVSSDDESMADVKTVDSDLSQEPSASTGFFILQKAR